MKPILYPANESEFVNNGLGRLSEATKCLVTEERNGQYELEMMYPITGLHYADICEERIIAARHDDSGDIQPFRIYKITRPMNGMVTVYARHISYQLSKVTVTPFTANTCADALEGMLIHAEGDCPFSIWTDRLLEANFSVNVPSTFRSLLGGVSGSILDVFGPGEYEWDKFTVKFHSHRGRDDSVMIRWGKNMTDVKKTTDSGNIWTGVLPFWSGITVTPSDIEAHAETDALALCLKSEGRSNAEENRAEWVSSEISAALTGFNFKSDGWQPDDEGITALRVSGDARVTIPYKIFETINEHCSQIAQISILALSL